jgi:DNA-binding NtrC family response regulator
MDKLIGHYWPGNVRELENCVMRAVVIASGSVIRPEHLSIQAKREASVAALSSLDNVEKEHLSRVLKATDGQKGRAAEILGVSRPRLNRMLQKFGLD